MNTVMYSFINLNVIYVFVKLNKVPRYIIYAYYIYINIVIVIVIFIWWNPFIPFRNLDEVILLSLITIYMALMSLRSRSHVKASMVLTRADHLFIHNYTRSLINNILRPILYN